MSGVSLHIQMQHASRQIAVIAGEFWPRVNPLREEIAAAFETLTHTERISHTELLSRLL
jgi:hypothetical protein